MCRFVAKRLTCLMHSKKPKKALADTVLEAVLKSLKKWCKDGDQFEALQSSWTATMNDLASNKHITEAIPWIAIPTEQFRSRDASQRPQLSVRNTEAHVRQNIPQILHANWTASDRERANQVYLPPIHVVTF